MYESFGTILHGAYFFMMKKLIMILAALVLILSAGCAAAPAETTTVPTQQTTVPTTEVTTVPETTIPETTVAVTELTLVDDENCTVIIKGYDGDALLGYGVNVYLENKTDKELVFSLGEVSVNGYMCDPFWAATVSAGKGITEHLKEENQMEWVCRIQNIEARIREIICSELII